MSFFKKVFKAVTKPVKKIFGSGGGGGSVGASLPAPAKPIDMALEQIKERDRMMMQSIQSLAMDRLRTSVRSLSRETQFQSRPKVEPFSYSPLYVPNQNEQ
jgi:hypothetical protein